MGDATSVTSGFSNVTYRKKHQRGPGHNGRSVAASWQTAVQHLG